ncbi:MAG TPA: sigma-70 family RNA polymerase sigma factor [Acidimicrobiales bacterium]|nr:sigma-70 family RNA polymerase sigma factor [Acidimicrobiales bacterium]
MLGTDFDSAFRELYLPAYAVALRILGDRQDAEDAASEALARTLASWRRVRDLHYRRAWVLRVTANVAVDMARRRRRPTLTDAADRPAVGGFADERLVLAHALRRLPRRQREVLVLRFLADLTEAQVAEQLRITPGAVKQHTRRGLAALRKVLGAVDLEVSLAF